MTKKLSPIAVRKIARSRRSTEVLIERSLRRARWSYPHLLRPGLFFSLCCVIVFCLEQAGRAEQSREIPASILRDLEDALAERDSNVSHRLEVAKAIDAFFEDHQAKQSNEVWQKARFVEAVAHMRLNQLDRSATQIKQLQDVIDAQRSPEMWFRCRSLSASLGVMRGERAESLKAFEELLSGNLQGVPRILVDRARTNYAVALEENGRIQEAEKLYETIMLEALQLQNDRAALHAGNNLLAMLLEESNLLAARHVLKELEPLMDRGRDEIATQSIRLRKYDLLRSEDQNEAAIQGMQEFIAMNDRSAPPILLGSAHRLLASALCEQGSLEEALIHAQKSVDLSKPVSRNATDAFLTLAQVHMKKQDYDHVLNVLDQLGPNATLIPKRKRTIHQLRLEATLRQQGRDEEVELLRAMMDANRSQEQLHSKSVADYFESKLAAMHRDLAMQKLESQSRFTSEKTRWEQRNRFLLFGFLTAGGLCASLLLYLDVRRRGERTRIALEKAQNEKLEALVERKTQELKASLEARAEMTEALERKKRFETIGHLASNVAHDINNLLQVISNANEGLANPQVDANERREILTVSNHSLKHGSGIIRHLLAYSRQQELSAQAICLHEYLNECLPLLRSAVGDGMELQLLDHSQLRSVFVDPSHLTTSLLNLLSNSVDAMPQGGKVILETSIVSLPDALSHQWNHLQSGEYVLIAVADTGCGMSKEQVHRAFEPFYSTKEVGKGAGLGLSSVFGFVKQSGGDIRMTSELNKGTRVEFVLPACAAQTPKTEPLVLETNQPMAATRLLLVEDQEALAMSLSKLLCHLKVQPHWVPTGDEAKRFLEVDPHFDIVLSDVHMPGTIDGLALAKWIRAEKPHINVLLMSGYHDIPQKDFDFPLLTKPFNMRELASHLAKFSDEKKEEVGKIPL